MLTIGTDESSFCDLTDVFCPDAGSVLGQGFQKAVARGGMATADAKILGNELVDQSRFLDQFLSHEILAKRASFLRFRGTIDYEPEANVQFGLDGLAVSQV